MKVSCLYMVLCPFSRQTYSQTWIGILAFWHSGTCFGFLHSVGFRLFIPSILSVCLSMIVFFVICLQLSISVSASLL